ncbi:hypothetical protein PAMP_013103 [Pampus punctatissimus]
MSGKIESKQDDASPDFTAVCWPTCHRAGGLSATVQCIPTPDNCGCSFAPLRCWVDPARGGCSVGPRPSITGCSVRLITSPDRSHSRTNRGSSVRLTSVAVCLHSEEKTSDCQEDDK